MPKSIEALIAHDDESVRERLTKVLTSIKPDINIIVAESVQHSLDESMAGKFDILFCEFNRPACDGKRVLESLEDLKFDDRPQHVFAIADLIDRGFLNVDLPSLVYLRKGFQDHEIKAAIGSALGLQEKKTLDSGFLMPFITGAADTVKIMAQTDAEREKIEFKRINGLTDISAVIPLVSDNFYGSIALSFEKSCFLGVVSRMLGDSFSEITDDLKDAASEICNQMYGAAKSKLNEAGHSLKMAIPAVVLNQPAPHSVEGRCLSVTFKTEFGRFGIEIIIQ